MISHATDFQFVGDDSLLLVTSYGLTDDIVHSAAYRLPTLREFAPGADTVRPLSADGPFAVEYRGHRGRSARLNLLSLSGSTVASFTDESVESPPRGRRFLSRDQADVVRLREAVDGRAIGPPHPVGNGGNAQFTDDGRLVKIYYDGKLTLWSALSGGRLPVPELPSGVNEILMSPDGAYVVVTGDLSQSGVGPRLLVWDVRAGRRVPLPGFPGTGQLSVTMSGGGAWLIVADFEVQLPGQKSYLIDLRSGRVIQEAWNDLDFAGMGNTDTFLMVDRRVPGGKLGTAIDLWDLRTGDLGRLSGVHGLPGSPNYPSAPLLNHHETALATLDRDTLLVVDLRTRHTVLSVPVKGPGNAYFTLDDSRLIVQQQGVVDLYDAVTGVHISAFAPGLPVSYDGDWNGFSLDEAPSVYPHATNRVGPEDTSATDNFDGPLDGWTVDIEDRGASVVSADGRWLLCMPARGETARLWSLSDGKFVRDLVGHSGPVRAMGFLPNGRMAVTVGDDDDTIRLWDLTPAPVSRS